jgi:hypothetical protein
VRAYIIDDPLRRLRRMTLANNGYHAFVGLAPPYCLPKAGESMRGLSSKIRQVSKIGLLT